jgi:hypothetical protein
VLGTWFTRLIGYAWPIFFVALPLLFDRVREKSAKTSRDLAALGFFGVHMLVSCLAYPWFWLAQVSADLVLWTLGFFLLRHWLVEEDPFFDCSDLKEHQKIESA